MIIKLRAELAGGHYHVGMWMGRTEGSLGKCGNVCFAENEWPVFAHMLRLGRLSACGLSDHIKLIIEETNNGKEPTAAE